MKPSDRTDDLLQRLTGKIKEDTLMKAAKTKTECLNWSAALLSASYPVGSGGERSLDIQSEGSSDRQLIPDLCLAGGSEPQLKC